MDSVSTLSSSLCPSTPAWNLDRPFLTGQFYQETKVTPGTTEYKGFSTDSCSGADKAIGYYHATIQELIVIDDLLSTLIGIEGHYISIKKVRGKEDDITFQVDASMDLALQEFAKRLFPLCKSYILVNQFVETRSQFKTGLVNHAFATALRALLVVSFLFMDPSMVPWWILYLFIWYIFRIMYKLFLRIYKFYIREITSERMESS